MVKYDLKNNGCITDKLDLKRFKDANEDKSQLDNNVLDIYPVGLGYKGIGKTSKGFYDVEFMGSNVGWIAQNDREFYNQIASAGAEAIKLAELTGSKTPTVLVVDNNMEVYAPGVVVVTRPLSTSYK